MSLDITIRSKDLVTRTCPYCNNEYEDYEELYEANITHNLTDMAQAAKIYNAL